MKQHYNPPKLMVYGDIDQLTQGGRKVLGFDDGFFLNTPDNPIGVDGVDPLASGH